MASNRFVFPFTQSFQATTGAAGAGWKLYFYETGSSSTLKSTYSDRALTTPNANPVVADAAGRFGNIFLESKPYNVILKDSNDVTIASADPVSYETEEGVVYASDYATLAAAVTAASGKELVISENTIVTANTTISGCGLRFVYPGNLDPNTGVTVTANAEYLVPSTNCFDKTALGVITSTAQMMLSGPGVSVLWFGAKGDGGTTDNLTAFNNARTMARANNAPVYVPPSAYFYRLDGTYDMDELGDSLVGAGRDDSVFWFNTTNPGVKINAYRWHVSNIGVAGKSGSGHGFHIGTGGTTAGYGSMNDVWVGWVGAHGIYLAGAISSTFTNVSVDTNNGYRPANLLSAASLGTEQWQWYITKNTNGINYDCEFINCHANGGGALGNIKIGESGGKVQSLKWFGGLAQGGDDTHLYITGGENIIIEGIHMEGQATIPNNRWALTIEDSSTTVVRNSYCSGDVRLIGTTTDSGFEHSVCCGIEIAATCGNGNFIRHASYGGQTTGPAGGRIRDYSNVALLENNQIGTENSTVIGNTLDSVSMQMFSTNMDDWYTNPTTLPCGFTSSGLTPSKETTIKLTGTNSLKCVAGAAGQYVSITIPNVIQLRGKRIAISTHVYQVTSSSLVTVRVNKNGGTYFDQGGAIYGADAWYRKELSFKVPADASAIAIEFSAGAAGTFYVNDLLIITDGSYEETKGAALDTVAIPELNPDNSFHQPQFLYTGAGTNITDFKRPHVGKPFTLIFTDNRTVVHGATIKLNGSANFVGTVGDMLTLFYNGLDNIFYELSRMVQ